MPAHRIENTYVLKCNAENKAYKTLHDRLMFRNYVKNITLSFKIPISINVNNKKFKCSKEFS